MITQPFGDSASGEAAVQLIVLAQDAVTRGVERLVWAYEEVCQRGSCQVGRRHAQPFGRDGSGRIQSLP